LERRVEYSFVGGEMDQSLAMARIVELIAIGVSRYLEAEDANGTGNCGIDSLSPDKGEIVGNQMVSGREAGRYIA